MDWRALSNTVQGRVVLPSSPGYSVEVQSYNPVFDGARPAGIAYCASAGDVAAALRFAQEHGLELSVRSGGHCYGG